MKYDDWLGHIGVRVGMWLGKSPTFLLWRLIFCQCICPI